MPVQIPVPRPREGRPLSADEWAAAERVAARMHGELRRLLGALPEHAQGASGMSRHLGVLRATCQRVVSAVQDAEPTPLLLTRLPGVQGLHQFLEGMRRVGVSGGDVDSTQAAVEQFERLIEELAGSQSKLAERLDAAAHAGTGSSPIASQRAREELFRAAAAVCGRECDVALTIYAFRVPPGEPDIIEHAMVKGSIGHLMAPGGMPLVLASGMAGSGIKFDQKEMRLLDRSPAHGRTPEAVLQPFSTDPLPLVTMRHANGTLMQIVDPETARHGQLIDVVTAVRGREPLMRETGKPTLDAVWTLNNCPARRLIVDVYLHEDIERLYRPSMDVQLWNPNLSLPDEDRWVSRLPGTVRLTMLGRGLSLAACESYKRHGELTQYFYERIGWDPERFVGFRCEVVFPIWRGGYVMSFDYAGGATPQT